MADSSDETNLSERIAGIKLKVMTADNVAILKGYIDDLETTELGHALDDLLAKESVYKALLDIRGAGERTVLHAAAKKADHRTLCRIRHSLSKPQWLNVLEHEDTRDGDTALSLAATNHDMDTVYYILYESLGDKDDRATLLKKTNKEGLNLHRCPKEWISYVDFERLPTASPAKVKKDQEQIKERDNNLKRYIDGSLPTELNQKAIDNLLADTDKETVRQTLLNIRGADKRTVLHTAAEKADHRTLCRIRNRLSKPQWLDVLKHKDTLGNTALHLAATNDHPDTMYYILYESLGDKVDRAMLLKKTNKGSLTPVHCPKKWISYVEFKRLQTADPASPAEVKKAQEQIRERANNLRKYIDGSLTTELDQALDDLLANTEEYLHRTLLHISDTDNYTVLHTAAEKADHRTLCRIRNRLSIPNWVDALEQEDTFGNTALHLAATNDHPDTMSFILYESLGDKDDRAMLLKKKNKEGLTPVHFAVKWINRGKFEKIFQINQLDFWIDVLEVQCEQKNTVVHEAVYKKDLHKLKAMLEMIPNEKKANLLNMQNKEGTALYLAEEQGSTEIIKFIEDLTVNDQRQKQA